MFYVVRPTNRLKLCLKCRETTTTKKYRVWNIAIDSNKRIRFCFVEHNYNVFLFIILENSIVEFVSR